MKDPKQRILTWRAEIATELQEAVKLVPPLEDAHSTAEAAAHAALADYGEVQRLIGPVVSQPEAPFRLRIDAHLTEVEQAKSRRTRALADLQAARMKVAGLQRALGQIDRIIAPADAGEAA